MKYPWDDDIEIDWGAGWQDIALRYQDKFFQSKQRLIEYYFASKGWKAGCILGRTISALLAYCLFVVTP